MKANFNKTYCYDCIFFEPDRGPIKVDSVREGECRYFPADGMIDGWAKVKSTDWCGEGTRQENEKT